MLSEHDCPSGVGKRWPQPGELRSLWDMVKLIEASDIADAGDQLRIIRLILSEHVGPVVAADRKLISEAFYKLAACCRTLEEGALADMFTSVMADEPKRDPNFFGQFELLENTFWTVLFKKQLYYIESGHLRYLDEDGKLMPGTVRKAFPGAASELIQAGKAFCFGLYDGAVLHCMRAVEIGARRLAVALNCQFQHPLEQVDFHPLLEQCEKRINDMKQLPKSAAKAEELEFYSTAASNFRYFKDGWRIRATHGRASFQEIEAERLLTRSMEFFEVISSRLKE